MSLFSELTSVAGNAGNFAQIVAMVKKAIADGVTADSPMGQKITAFIKEMIPDIAGAPDIVQKIDDLIPDAVQSKFGFTPQVMTFIKEALGGVRKKV